MSYKTILWFKTVFLSQNVPTWRLLLKQISIATTSTILHLMSRSKTALVHLNMPFLENLSILILRINHHACVGICLDIPAESFLVSYSNASLWQWNYLQTDTVVRHEKSYTYRHQRSCMNEAIGGAQTLSNYAQLTVTHTRLYESSMLT